MKSTYSICLATGRKTSPATMARFNAMRNRQFAAGYYGVITRSWWPLRNGRLVCPLP